MIVVGAGVAGLCFARDLAMRGVQVTVIEAANDPGGVLLTRPLGDVAIDAGAESFAIARPEARALISELGLDAQVVSPARSDAHLALIDRIVPLPPGLLGIPLDLSDPRVVDVIGPAAAHAAQLADVSDTDVPITLGAIVRSRMGDAVADQLVDPVVSGVHATRADRAEADTVIPRLRPLLAEGLTLREAAARIRGNLGSAGSAVASLDGGMGALVRALRDDAQARGVEILCGVRVTNVHRAPNDRWVVVTSQGILKDDNVCIAVPGPHAAALLQSVPSIAGPLESVVVSDVAVAALLVRTTALDVAPVGSGVLVSPHRTDVQAKAMTHATAKWQWLADSVGPGRHVVRLSYGRAGEPTTMTDDEILAAATRDLAVLTACPITVTDVEAAWVQRWNGSLVDPLPGHAELIARVRAAATSEPGMSLIGSCLGGNGIAGVVADTRATASTVAQRICG